MEALTGEMNYERRTENGNSGVTSALGSPFIIFIHPSRASHLRRLRNFPGWRRSEQRHDTQEAAAAWAVDCREKCNLQGLVLSRYLLRVVRNSLRSTVAVCSMSFLWCRWLAMPPGKDPTTLCGYVEVICSLVTYPPSTMNAAVASFLSPGFSRALYIGLDSDLIYSMRAMG